VLSHEKKKDLKISCYSPFKMLKSTLDRVLAFAKKIPALVNLRVINMNGKNYLKRKVEPIPMKLPKIYKNEGATCKYPKYTDTKACGHIPEIFVAYKMFSSQTGHVFFWRLYLYVFEYVYSYIYADAYAYVNVCVHVYILYIYTDIYIYEQPWFIYVLFIRKEWFL
jgi:hypothetical protein